MCRNAEKALQKYEESLKAGDKYAYIDLNNDEVKELVVADRIYYFDYSVNRVKSIRHQFSDFVVGTNKSFFTFTKIL